MVETEMDQVVDLEKGVGMVVVLAAAKEVAGDLVEMEDLMVEQEAKKVEVVLMADLTVAELTVD